jgi:magnesium transporter
MIRAFKYSKKEVKKFSLSKLNLLRDLCWIDSKPDKEEIKAISKKLNINMHDLIDCSDKREIPRTINRKNYSMIIFRSPKDSNTIPFGIFIGKRFLLTVHKEEIKSITNLISSMKKEHGKSVFKEGIGFLAYRLLMDILKEYSISLDAVGENLETLENRVFKSASDNDLNLIFSFKRKMIFFKKSLVANQNVIKNIYTGEVSFINKNVLEYFGSLHTEMTQIISERDLYRERLTETMNMYMTSVSNRLNDIMKGFTVIASLLLLPTLITGIWGMNFKFIPFFNHPFGFYIPFLFMVITITIMLLYFKNKKWI